MEDVSYITVGYSSIAVTTTLDEEYLIPTKKKGKKKEDVVEQKEIPPPPNISISEADLSSIKVSYFVLLSHAI